MRFKHFTFSATLAVVLFIAPSMSKAQFVNGKIYLGPHFAISSYGGNISLGGNIEGAITQPGSAGPGRIALAGRFDIAFYTGGNILLFSGIANYHYSVADDKIDLFGGLGITFFTFSSSYYSGSSQLYPAMDLGLRYFTNSGMALRGMLGIWNYPYLTFGVDWAL
ncbi:MAG: hypothetical protein Q8916_12955 [Bacteroidota bacterium]|nr:hypothetical protein [Bacteroidota bacterium]MDP4237022.1 hypothetical protein [Bacteroidota bacterium]